MQKVASNNFIGGLNTDHDKNILESQFYTDAHNVELVSDGGFLALKNLKGTTEVQGITNTVGTEVLGIFENYYTIGVTANVKCLTIFTAKNSGNFKIWCYDTENDITYELYEEAVASDYITDDRIIDARSHAENGIDIIYFTDFLNEVRQLRCEIPVSHTPSPTVGFLSEADISLLRRGANGIVELTTVSYGGTLLSGTYQFAYRMVNPATKKYTKWSTLTNPIHVYGFEDGTNLKFAGIGLPTTIKITLTITPTDIELDNFDQYQLAVVENIYPTGAESITSGTSQTFVAALLDVESISAPSATYIYKSNTKVGTIPIEDLVVDLAPIETVKTLAIKENKLFAANIKYRDLTLDNGTPSATGSIAILAAAAFTHDDMVYATTRKGYFRDEVYRYAIVYYDKYGNYSEPSVLDLEGITDNQITAGIPDVKFPARWLSNSWCILDSTGLGYQRMLGLDLTISNHPTWAVGFEILRAKRIKRVLFQTPVIGMTTVEGVGAFERYPSDPYIGNADFKEYTDAQPMTSSKVYIPKNLFWPEMRDIEKRTTRQGSGANLRYKGESRLSRRTTYDYACIFPQQDLYEKSAYNYVGNEQLETVDFCLLKLDDRQYDTSTDTTYGYAGNQINTKVTGTFYATSHNQYYFDPVTASYAAKTRSDPNPIIDYIAIPQGSEGTTLGGEKVLTYGDLKTDGVESYGYTPTNQAMSVIRLRSSFNDEGGALRTFAAGVHNAYNGSSNITGSSDPEYETEGTEAIGSEYSNKYVFDYTGCTASSYVQVVRIGNVVRNEIGDNRYGDVYTQHDFISTGAKYAFSTLELADVESATPLAIPIEVWGGDCFINRHIFKISDSTYSVINQTKNNDSADPRATLNTNWNEILYLSARDGTDPTIMMPIGLEKVSQFIQVYLESEYNGGVMDKDVVVQSNTVAAIVMVTDREGDIKTPLTYNYNINLSKQNDQKIFRIKPRYFQEQNTFGARVVVSDQKVYNSDIQGFDIFRVLDFKDLSESMGNITKLTVAGDRMYAVQEKGVVYLPVGQTQLEQTDAGILSVGTGSDIGRPIVIDSVKGGQHLAAIVETGNITYIPDNINKSVYMLAGQELKYVSINNDTLFRTMFADEISERTLIGIYDQVRKQYWLASPSNCYVLNEQLGAWTANYEFGVTLKGGRSTNQKLYLMGEVSDQISVHEMYTGNYASLFGQTVTPRVTFVVNPEAPLSKTFDDIMFVATERLASIDFEVQREALLGSQTGTILVDNISIENNFRAKIMRDADGARFRGTRLLTTVNWKTTNVGSSLSAVLTKYRLSSRNPF